MIITGAPLETIEYEDVDYWEELCEIMDWTLTNVCSTLYICWGAMAGLYHHYGIQKRQMESKVSGIYEHRVLIPNEPIVRGFDDRFFMPQSRHTEVRAEDITANPHLHIVCASEESGVAVVQSERNQTFITGHLEYDAATLAYEYERDLKAGKHPHVPDHYFEDDDPRSEGNRHWLTTLGFTSFPTMASLTNGLRPDTSPSPSRTACTSLEMWVNTSLKILQESLPLSSRHPS